MMTSQAPDAAASNPAPCTGAPCARQPSASVAARAAVRLTIKMFCGLDSSKAGITPFTAPPAPMTNMRLPASDQPAPAVISATSPLPSVLSAMTRPSGLFIRKFAAPADCARAEASSASSKARVLKGRVTFSPLPSCAKKSATQRSKSSIATHSAR